jgi:hypothetical protein
MEQWWKDNDGGGGGSRITGKRTCHSATSFARSFTWTGLGLNPGLRGKGPVTEVIKEVKEELK